MLQPSISPIAVCRIPAAGAELAINRPGRFPLGERILHSYRSSPVKIMQVRGVQAMLMRVPQADVQSMGSVLKFCLIAEGKADIYLRDLPTMEWDTAAAHCIAEEAGGKVYSLDGKPLLYGKPRLTNPAIMTIGDPAFNWMALIC